MKIDARRIGNARILDCSGKITLGEGTMSIRNAVPDNQLSGAAKIVLNLANIDYTDKADVGNLMCSYARGVNSNGQLKLLDLTKRIWEVLTITKLLTVFDTFDGEKAALMGSMAVDQPHGFGADGSAGPPARISNAGC